MLNSDKIILDLCGGTGCWSKPYRDAGYDVRIITLPDYDILHYCPPSSVYGVLAAPPCTAFSLASAHCWKKFDENGFTDYSLRLVKRCFEIASITKPKFFALENPKGRLRKLIGINPIFQFYQYEFGGLFFKPTYLWGDFNTLIVRGPVNDHPIYFSDAKLCDLYELPSDYQLVGTNMSRRSAARSMYPPAFCHAFFDANQ